MTRNLRSANNFSDVTLTTLGPEVVELAVNDVLADGPEYFVGFLQRGLELTGTKARVTVKSMSGDSAMLITDWSKKS